MLTVVFKLASECFGIPVEQVKEVVKLSVTRPLPQAPSFVDGIIALRGHSVAVMDLARRLNIARGDLQGKDRKVLIVRVEQKILGLIVDDVMSVLEVEQKAIDAAARVVNGSWQGKAVAGIAHSGGKEIILLDLKNLLNPEENQALEKVKR
ncbi:MAG: chemotaxis protein CheW [Chlamydiae bacterium]|nr:chemotaxis protein CheW [Chlamydiota bacterium]MBI3266796.1 chemotaxis protein CheW [Chlamydiota bacterium]